MKICLLLAICMIVCSFNNGKDIIPESGVYKNGKLESSLQSAYSGGAIADPTKGSSYRLRLYDVTFDGSLYPQKSKEIIYISGFKYRDTEYTRPGQYIDNISINDLFIPLNQGVYENGNPDVISVDFISFDTSIKEPGKINISIKLKNGKRIDIIYNGQISYDGLY